MITKKTVYCVYKTDAWLYHSSKRLIGIFTNKKRAINAIKFIAIEIKEPLTTDDYYNIENISQTQLREINFMIEQTILNKSYYE